MVGEIYPQLGFIPTRAGKMLKWVLPTICRRVHPHSRGENLTIDTAKEIAMGSSPLARGKSAERGPELGGWGFIPTRAGKMLKWVLPTICRRVHPHSRGENHATACAEGSPEGSSPLARGKCVCCCWWVGGAGFIPTRAGKIARSTDVVCGMPVHPHSRGENGIGGGLRTGYRGSSPLARGKLATTIRPL